MYENRFYRNLSNDKNALEVSYRESDIYLVSEQKYDKNFVKEKIKYYYDKIEKYIRKDPNFFSSLSPLEYDDNAPDIVKDMLSVSSQLNVGPFAAVAGAVSDYLGKSLLKLQESKELIIENGGDIFIKTNKEKEIGLYLGKDFSPQFIKIILSKQKSSFGICSSSSKIGHSLNFGKADLVTVVGSNPIFCDAAATAYSNAIKNQRDIEKLFKKVKKERNIQALLVAYDKKIFLWGNIALA